MKRTPLRVAIPEEMREELSADPFMQRCILDSENCDGRIQWHHAFSYGGRRQTEKWAILPACEYHHRTEAQHRDRIHHWLKQRINHFSAWYDVQTKYPKATWI